MRIAAARVLPVRLRFVRPVRTARGEFADRPSVLLGLTDSEGVTGLGEAAPWPGFGTETDAEALAALEDVSILLRDADCGPRKLPGPVVARLRLAPAARAALQGALWDLAARSENRPLADCLAASMGLAAREVLREVPVSALLVEREPEALRDEAARARAAGHRAAKIKLGAKTLEEDLARARAAREGLGPGVALRGDANGAWSVAAAAEALAALAEFQFNYVEQPVAADNIAGLAALRGRTPVRIAADESVVTEEGVGRLIEARAADVFILKPAMLGGAARALEIAARVREAGGQVVFSHAFESAVGARHALHCAAAWGDAAAIHGLGTLGLFVEDVAEPVTSAEGCVVLDGSPGLGIEPGVLDRPSARGES